jgi:iron complex transport system substrate-binding protein
MNQECVVVGDPGIKAERIVSLAPSFTETVRFIGLSNKLLGCTEHCDKTGLDNISIIGGFSKPDISQITALKPDLILAMGKIHQRYIDELKTTGATILIEDNHTVTDVIDTIKTLVQLSGNYQSCLDRMDGLIQKMQDVHRRLRNTRPVRVYRLISESPLVTASPICFQYDAIEQAGGEQMILNTQAEYVPAKIEDVLKFDPEVIISCGKSDSTDIIRRCKDCKIINPLCVRRPSDIIENDIWKSTSAVKNGRIYMIDCAHMCYPGSSLIEGIDEMSYWLHPQIDIISDFVKE